MADTINADFSKSPCSDCGKKGIAYLKHWGPLVPSGKIGIFCGEDFKARAAENKAELEPRKLGTKPRDLK